MRSDLAAALEAGAWGMSTGFAYVPGAFADMAEVVDVGAALQRADALCSCHIRDEGYNLLPSVEEALAVGERLGTVADLVAFDPLRVRDEATYDQPPRLASGMEYVMKGGGFAGDRAQPIDLCRGRLLRRLSRESNSGVSMSGSTILRGDSCEPLP